MPNYELAAERAARRHGIDPHIFKALIRQESGFREGVKSGAGARDIAQFIPSTAKAYGVTLGDNRVSDDLDGAARYIKANLDKYGSYHRALSAYNSGRPDAYKDPGFAKGQTYNYVRSILSNAKGESVQGGSVPTRSGTPSARTQTTSRTIPGVDRSQERRALILQFLQQRGRPGAITSLATGLDANADTPARTVRSTRVVKGRSSSAQPSSHGEIATFDGKPVASWIKPLLQYARERGWKGTVQSGVRTDAEQTRIYKSGVRPAAVPKSLGGAGSKHEQTGFLRGAVDVTDAATLDRILRAKHSRLKFAGARDPVHFSVPTHGSY